MPFFRRDRAGVGAARKEREKSEQRLAAAKALTAHIERIREENHFADAIVAQLMKRPI
jgi:hypothetical protein